MRVMGMLVLAAVTLGSMPAHAQLRGMGRFAGTVTDEGGAPIEGVRIIAKLETTGGKVEEVTDAKGTWAVGGIGKGIWVVEFYKPGFLPRNAKVILERELDKVPAIKLALRKS